MEEKNGLKYTVGKAPPPKIGRRKCPVCGAIGKVHWHDSDARILKCDACGATWEYELKVLD